VAVADAKSQQPNLPTDTAPMQRLQEDFVVSGGQQQGAPQKFEQPATARILLDPNASFEDGISSSKFICNTIQRSDAKIAPRHSHLSFA
jgi:hypothetical protein